MSKTQVFVKQAAGDVREVEVESGGVVRLSPGEHLVIAASPNQAQVDSDSPGEVTIKLEGVGEFTVESAGDIPEQIAQAPEIMGIRPLPTIVFEPTRVDLAEDAPTHEPLGVHQARVDSTAFLDRHTGDDFGMGQALDMAEFSGLTGAGLSGHKIASDEDEDGLSGDSLDDLLADGLSGDPQDHPNIPPVIDLNNILLVDDNITGNLTGHLRATDRESGPEDLRFRISQGPAYGTLYIDGKEVDATTVTFTQADIDSGLVTFRFAPHAQERVLAFDDDTFVFTVTDGTHTTDPATFHIHNTTVQVWGTDNTDGDDLTKVTNFDRDGAKFHVYGFDGNDTLRGGADSDTLDGGGHASTDVVYTEITPRSNSVGFNASVTVHGVTPGGDTVDYRKSDAPVDVDLTRERQSGGHAEGDTLVDIENVTGSRHEDTLCGDDEDNVLAGLAGADLLDGRLGRDTADYRESDAPVYVDLTRTGAQSGGHAQDDTLVGIENVIGSDSDDSIVGHDGDNFLDGGEGNDTLLGGKGKDILRGGAGADSMNGGEPNPSWFFKIDQDMADYSTSDAPVNVDLTRKRQSGGHAEGDTLVGIGDVMGSRWDDVITGDANSNRLWGGDGSDTIHGGAGFNIIHGEAGNDEIYGGTGDDEIHGEAGNDTIFGGRGSDNIYGGDGDDYLVGYSPDVTSHNVEDYLYGGAGNDTLDASHMTGPANSGYGSRLHGGAGADMLIGNGVNTGVSYVSSVNGDVSSDQGVYLDLSRQGRDERGNWLAQIDPEGRDTDAVGDTLRGIANAEGSLANDTLIGNHQNNNMYGEDGNDLMFGNEGDDTLWGDDGADTLEGGEGADFLHGFMGFDMVSYENAAPNNLGLGVLVDLGNQSNYNSQAGTPGAGGEEVGDELWYIDGVIGSAHDDTLIGGSVGDEEISTYGSPNSYAANRLEGGAGNDLLMGLGGADTLDGGEGIDTADYSLSEAEVLVDLNLAGPQTGGGEVTKTPSISDIWNPGILYGGNHARGDVLISIENVTGSGHGDTLIGNGKDNVLSGLAGDDSLVGGGGNDTLIGGDGDDLIVGGFTDSVDGGAGFDTFRLEDNIGTGSTLDLSAMNDAGRISGIERIDITGDADDASTLTLRAEDVFKVSGGSLYIDGDAGDSVTTTGAGWTQEAGDVSFDGHTYHHYTALYGTETVNLYVETDVAYRNE